MFLKKKLPVPSKRASKPNDDVNLSKPNKSTKTIVLRITKEVKNPYIDATIMNIQYESQIGSKIIDTPLKKI